MRFNIILSFNIEKFKIEIIQGFKKFEIKTKSLKETVSLKLNIYSNLLHFQCAVIIRTNLTPEFHHLPFFKEYFYKCSYDVVCISKLNGKEFSRINKSKE